MTTIVIVAAVLVGIFAVGVGCLFFGIIMTATSKRGHR